MMVPTVSGEAGGGGISHPAPGLGRPLVLDLKAGADALLLPLARRVPLHPNVITGLGVLVMALAAALAAQGELRLAGVAILGSGLLDILDGAVAKARGLGTPFGALLDRVADRTADLLIVAGLMLGGAVDLPLGLLVLGPVLVASYASACVEAFTRSDVGEGLSLRPVRLVLLALGCLSGAVVAVAWLLAAIGAVSLVHRLRVARRLQIGRAHV